jgi:glycosyltransferase involved in cell wall biosynthesis
MVSFTHGEGFGRPLLEATMTGLPVITTGWSGQLDFLNPTESLLLNGDLQAVPKSQHWENIVIPQSKWFIVNQTFGRNALNHCQQNYNIVKKKAKDLMNKNRENFTLNKMTLKFENLLEKYLKNMPQQVSLNLPKLKKVDQNENKIKLPKLKKIGSTEATV